MMTREQLKLKYQAIHEHFNFKDFLGLSALIFGLLLSNSSLEPVTAQTEVIKKQKQIEREAPPVKKPVKKKVSKTKKKVRKTKKRRQQVTAANE